MCPKPVEPRRAVDLDRALDTLRRETPSPDAVVRARAALSPSPRRPVRLARPLALTMVVTSLALVVLMPRTHAGAAWAQTLAQTADAPASHSVHRAPDGSVSMEEWREGAKRALVLYGKGGIVQVEMRSDGHRSLNYFDFFDMAAFQHAKLGANAFRWASLYSGRSPRFAEVAQDTVEKLLAEPTMKVLEHRPAQGDRPETYRIRHTMQFGKTSIEREFTAEIDATTRRVSAIVQGGSRTAIEYPATINPHVFEPRAQAVKNVETIDTAAVTNQVLATVRKGIAKSGPVTLRAVLLDGDGNLWAFWTGALPDGKLTHPFTAPGVPLGPAFGTKLFTSNWRQSPPMNGRRKETTGERLGGMARAPKVKIGSTVDLNVPYAGGIAHFHHVPVVHIGLINHLDAALGVVRKYE